MTNATQQSAPTTNRIKAFAVGGFYLLAGVVLTIAGFSYDAFDVLYTVITVSAFILGVLPLALPNGLAVANYLARIVVGSVFVVSGLIKANDALGFSYKLEEYFAENALGWVFFEPYALAMSILVSVGEVVLGLAVLFGGKARVAAIALLALTLFFAWLTFYTAQCDPSDTYIVIENGVEVEKSVNCVTDCGCFGDAMKDSIGRSLTPWESFKKDMVLLVYVLIILLHMGKIKLNTTRDDLIILPASLLFVLAFAGYLFGWYLPFVFTLAVSVLYLGMKRAGGKIGTDWPIAVMATAVTLGFTVWCLNFLPQKDFRPYKIGTNMVEERKDCSERGLPCPKLAYVYIVKDKATGVEREMLSTTYVSQYKDFEYVSNTERQIELLDTTYVYIVRNKATGQQREMLSTDFEANQEQFELVEQTDRFEVVKGYSPSIMDFNLFDADGAEHTDEILAQPKVLLFISKDLEKVTAEDFAAMAKLAADAEQQQIMPVAAVAGTDAAGIDSIRHAHNLSFPFYTLDQITAKTVVRSNPGVLMLQNSVITNKWSRAEMPSANDLLKN